ncbi:MAG TPA: hypothetical protein VJQ50_11055 [Terriglobales bacterium]|nr:hypothetical protein [Terriglobales bacterium]
MDRSKYKRTVKNRWLSRILLAPTSMKLSGSRWRSRKQFMREDRTASDAVEKRRTLREWQKKFVGSSG